MLKNMRKESGLRSQDIYGYMHVSRQSHHQWNDRERQREVTESLVLGAVRTIYVQADQIGGRKAYAVLQRDMPEIAALIGRDKVMRLRREYGYLPKKDKPFTPRPHPAPVCRGYGDLVTGRERILPGEVLASDMTFIWTRKGFALVIQVMDVASRYILAARVVANAEAASFTQVLTEALMKLPTFCHPIHHSDRGSQYTSETMHVWAVGNSVALSSAWCVYENTLIERLNKTMKEEYGFGGVFQDPDHVARALPSYIRNYNEYRPHWELGLRTPQSVFQERMRNLRSIINATGPTQSPESLCFDLLQGIGIVSSCKDFPSAPSVVLTGCHSADNTLNEDQNTGKYLFEA
jgi:putative transposase